MGSRWPKHSCSMCQPARSPGIPTAALAERPHSFQTRVNSGKIDMSTRSAGVILALCAPLWAWAGLSGDAVQGRVLEQGTDKPIPGAIVLLRWRGDLPGVADSKTVCFHVATTLTDEAGNFRIAARHVKPAADWQTRIINKEFSVVAYKKGYGWPAARSPRRAGVVLLAPFKGTVAERFQYFDRVISHTSCSHLGEIRKQLYWPWMALYEEARTIAITADQKKRADRLRSDAQSRLVDDTKPTTVDEYGRIVNRDPRDQLKVEPLR